MGGLWGSYKGGGGPTVMGGLWGIIGLYGGLWGVMGGLCVPPNPSGHVAVGMWGEMCGCGGFWGAEVGGLRLLWGDGEGCGTEL